MKWIMRLLVLLLVIFVVLVFARNVIVKTAVENGVAVVTGMPLSMKKLDLNLTDTSVDIEGLTVKNPAGFHDTVLVDIPKILVDYNLTDILKGKIHVENLEFELRQFSVVKNEKGMLNLDSLKALQKAQKPSKPAVTKEGKVMPFQIDRFRLRVDKASYVDFSRGKQTMQDFNIKLDETYRDITDPNKFVALIVVKVMARTPLALLSGFNLSGLQGSVSGIMGSATEMAGEYASKGLDALKSTTAGATTGIVGEASGTMKETASTVAGGVKSAASSIKNKLKLPFGN